eukprot:CAMPEP_0114494202 /NCGR_PEP_ID=MMETSP0109-20121206/4524_1 /TAXON_ID=29199 /ORGANISM="Chlorarachnion reptans, Strain CCCM449" /LENGTH=929 /DNA_ID=CAMNT_0001671219 /DNA_START=112 /DNA_END=2902 /DNA_ORIENTATION=-
MEASSSTSLPNISQLEEKVAQEPDNYDANMALVNALRKGGEEEKLQDARHEMCNRFPLPEVVWLEWIEDEEKIAEDEEDMAYLKGVFERAIKDYLSVEIWVKYAEFMWKARKSQPQEVEEVYKQAKAATGYHLAEGRKFWTSYRAYKKQLPDCKTEDIRQLYKQELGIPLLGMDETMSEYITWERSTSGKPPQPQLFKAIPERKNKGMDKRMSFEERLAPYAEKSPGIAYPELLQTWDEYISFETKNSKGKRLQAVKLLYERAVSMCFLSDILWKKYFAFVKEKLKDANILENLYQRATRNCPWSADIWIGYLRTVEGSGDTKAYMSAMQKAVQCTSLPPEGLCLVQLEYIDNMRRRLGVGRTVFYPTAEEVEKIAGLRAAFNMCAMGLEGVDDAKAKEEDLYFKFYAYWADIEMRCYGNAEQSRIHWEALLEKNIEDARVWKAYINQEKIFGKLEDARALYKRAVTSLPPTSWELGSLCNEWVRFERERGDLDTLSEARFRATKRINQMEELRRAESERIYREQLKQQATLEAAQKLQQEEAARRRNAQQKIESQADSAESPDEPTGGDEKVPAGAKRKRTPAEHHTDIQQQKRQRQEHSNAMNVEETDVPATSENFIPTSGEKATKIVEQKKADTSQNKWFLKSADKMKERKESCTAFIVGIARGTTDAQLESLFKSHGNITEIRHVRDGKGKSKRYAYIEYSDSKCVDAAVAALNRTIFNGKEISVSRSAPPTQSKKQKGRTAQPEPNTIFIKHLPKVEGDLRTAEAKRQEELRKHFAKCGEIKAVRLATECRKGITFLKKIAYVEFTNPESVRKAIKLSGTHLIGYPDSKPILIMKSCPPSKKTQILKKVPVTKRKGKKGSMISLVPRSVAGRKSKSLSRSSISDASKEDTNGLSKQEKTETGRAQQDKPKSNADFRALLLGKNN